LARKLFIKTVGGVRFDMANSSPLIRAVIQAKTRKVHPLPSTADAAADIDALLASFELQLVRRYFHQVHWAMESREACFADRAEPGLKLENVAAHSWHVADATIMIAPHFPFLDAGKAATLAVLHDKLEMFTGDFDPVGFDGRGTYSHAFHPDKQNRKTEAEVSALMVYLLKLRESIRSSQREIFLDIIHGRTIEALFVKSIDKLQALAYVYKKKAGNITDEHLALSIRYSRKAIEYFPEIQNHYTVMLDRLLDLVGGRILLERG